jgi:hypothetical protein
MSSPSREFPQPTYSRIRFARAAGGLGDGSARRGDAGPRVEDGALLLGVFREDGFDARVALVPIELVRVFGVAVAPVGGFPVGRRGGAHEILDAGAVHLVKLLRVLFLAGLARRESTRSFVEDFGGDNLAICTAVCDSR